MSSLRKSLITTIMLGAAVFSLTAIGATSEDKEKGPRKFYLTPTSHDGSQALSACAAGYHMASIWEILGPSNLRYNTQLGFTTSDSGSGPPSQLGWVRTGGEPDDTGMIPLLGGIARRGRAPATRT